VTFEDLMQGPCAWYGQEDSEGIAISSRIRLARNIDGYPFPARASKEQRLELREQIGELLQEDERFAEGLYLRLDELSASERMLLVERSLSSPEHGEESHEGALAVSTDTHDAVMVNEEDHLRLQVLRGGLSLKEVWEEMARLDDALEQRVNYAFSAKYGYLTCCPSNTGTGLRAGVMLHLPGLALMEEIRSVLRGLGKLGLAVRGLDGEGSDADGFLYQISNQMTLGRDEESLLADIQDVVEELVEHERNARLRLEEQRPAWLRDRVGRAVGILKNAWVLPSKEALDLLAMLRLGMGMGLLEWEHAPSVEQMMVEVRPAHLQRLAGRSLEVEERDRFRAQWMRSKLADLKKGSTL